MLSTKNRQTSHKKPRSFKKVRFPIGLFEKLKPRANSPFRVIKKINDNAYKSNLLTNYNTLATFNVTLL